MEESEKRRERLRAMRMEAETTSSSSSSSQQNISSVTPPIPPSLSNPLLENPEDSSSSSLGAPRFGFYTDPMAAFSSHKPKTGPPHVASRPQFHPPPPHSGPTNPEMPISGVNQFQNSYSPHQSMHQGGNSYYSRGPTTNLMGVRSPYPVHQGDPGFSPGPGRGHWSNNNRGPGGSPYPVHQGSPNFRSPPQGRGHWSNISPSSGDSPYPVHQGSPNFRSPPQGRGRGRWEGGGMSPGHGGGPSPSMGRGRGRWDGGGMSPAARHSGGRGRGYFVDCRARSLYDKSMVEDPWESLTPVIWRGENPARSNLNNRGFFQKTPSAKKPRVSDPVNTSNSKQSLAEFLAASFEEAAEDATGS